MGVEPEIEDNKLQMADVRQEMKMEDTNILDYIDSCTKKPLVSCEANIRFITNTSTLPSR